MFSVFSSSVCLPVARLLSGVCWKRMVLVVFVPFLVILLFFYFLIWTCGDSVYQALMVEKVRADSAVARSHLQRLEQVRLQRVLSLARSYSMHQQLEKFSGRSAAPDFRNFISREGELLGLSFLRFHELGLGGNQVYVEDFFSAWPETLRSEGVYSDFEVYSASRLAALGESARSFGGVQSDSGYRNLAQDQIIDAIAGPDCLVFRILVLVQFAGRVYGVLEAGEVLNRNMALVNDVSKNVYPISTLYGGSRGVLAFFLKNLQIVSSVDGVGAGGWVAPLGLTYRVLQEGKPWYDRFEAGKEFYMSAFTPLSSKDGRHLGMMLVGFTELPYRLLKDKVLYTAAFLLSVSFLLIWFLGSATVVCLLKGKSESKQVAQPD